MAVAMVTKAKEKALTIVNIGYEGGCKGDEGELKEVLNLELLD